MRILIITDAWHPQINGVVRTLQQTMDCLSGFGHSVDAITPQHFRNFPCLSYPEIRLAWCPGRKLGKLILRFRPCVIHIATEGPIGLAARRFCVKNALPFTSAYHTRFPEYIQARFRIPLSWSYRYLRWFHRPSRRIMVPTPTVREVLIEKGFFHTALWRRGVDSALFRPSARDALDPFCRSDGERRAPKFVYIGRVAVEKNIAAFLELDLPGSKWVIGDGPARTQMEQRYPNVYFLGAYPQQALPPFYNAADVFVFPSLTDTFGLVLLEAMACGTPVAAFPVAGPKDVVTDPAAGCLNSDLKTACLRALELRREDAAVFGARHSWENASRQFESLLHPFAAAHLPSS